LAWNTILIDGSIELLHWANKREIFATINRDEALHLALATEEAERVQFVLHDLQAQWTEETRERCLGIPELVHLLE
jgi:ribonucleotide reductase beta subunit family protein with ferritin-like domain